jgi:hypothetical protein
MRQRDSFIPLPEGFQPRRAAGPGLDFGPSRISSVHPAVPRPAARAPAPIIPSTTPAADARPSRSDSEQSPPAPPDAEAKRESASLPRLILAPIEPPQLIYDRAYEPTTESPILYRELAFFVDSLESDEELEDHLEAELSAIQASWQARDVPQFVRLTLFDHVFDGEPTSPPVASLSFKDWQGRKEVWVRGVCRSSTPPPGADTPAEHVMGEDQDGAEAEPIPLVSRPPKGSAAPADEADAPDSRTSWQSPTESGRYAVPEEDDESLAPPISQRVLAGEELIGALFERMHELLYLPDIVAGADYVLRTVEELIPCGGALVHIFDLNTKDFVVVRALGPHRRAVVLARTPGTGSHLDEALRHQTAIERGPGSGTIDQTIWNRLGLQVEFLLCCPMHQNRRYLGAIELGREAGAERFNPGQVNALAYICEQLAEFIADQPLDSIAEAILRPS